MNVTSVADWGFKLLLLSICITLLPQSPFQTFLNLTEDIPFLNYLNWFLPIDGILMVLQVWLQAVLVYCGYVIGHRYTGLVKGD